MTLPNLLIDSLQILFLISACGFTIFALRLDSPPARLLSLQTLLAVSLFLPLLQPRASVASRVTAASFGAFAAAAQTGSASGFTMPSPTAILLGLVVFGAAARLVWIAVGLFRLSRYRRNATPAPLAHHEMESRVGARADFFYSSEVPGPVTFGFLRPCILLPFSCAENSFVACHELIHVRRNDWIVALGEQLILALFWFHPAVWWLVARIQLVREQVVDREVVATLDGRDEYLNTLLAIASARTLPDLAPATLFLQKRHLRERVASLVQEVPAMTRLRLFSSAATLVATAAIVIFTCARALPLQAAPAVDDSSYLEVTTGTAKLLHRAPVEYPEAAREKGVEGVVVALLTLDDQGEVADARIVSGPPELRAPVLTSVLRWHFEKNPDLPSSLEITVTFRSAPNLLASIPAAPWPSGTPKDKPLTLSHIDLSSVPPALREAVTQAVTLREGQTVSSSDMAALSASLKQVDEHLALGVHSLDSQSVSLSVGVPGYGTKRIRVGSAVQAANLIHKVTPAYPPEAKAARIQGTVRFTAEIGKDGTIQNLLLESGDPLLVQAAQEAVRQWVYKPTLLNGDPIDVVTTIDVNFTLLP